MTLNIKELTWRKCSCINSSCTYEYPNEIGSFYQGTGFSPEEKEFLNEAVAALAMITDITEKAEEIRSRPCIPT